MNAVEIRNLTKKYKQKTAVDGISLTVAEGEMLALLGVNGAGKTTTVRMLSCLSEPTSGEAFICGHNCMTEKAAVKAVIGISPQDTSVSEKLTVGENLLFIAKLHEIDADACQARAEEMIRMFHMEEIRNSLAKTLSGGWKRKLSIAMALISKPKVLFLDEPTLGLDVLARRELWKAIEALKGSVTVILTTHYMEEAEHLADRIAIMMEGKIKVSGTLAEIEEYAGAKGLENAFVAIAEKEGAV